MNMSNAEKDVADTWSEWVFHENTPNPLIGRVGDLIDVRYFEIGYSSLHWHRDVFILTEGELAMDWRDTINAAIVSYRIQMPTKRTAQAMRLLHQIAHNPRQPLEKHLLDHLGGSRQASGPGSYLMPTKGQH